MTAEIEHARAEGVRYARDVLALRFHMHPMHLDVLTDVAAEIDRAVIRGENRPRSAS